MVQVTLGNQNPHSQHRQVSINIATGLCVFADQQHVELKRLINDLDFSHPLLTEQFIPTSDHLFHYEYDDIEGLLYSAIYVYSVLLQVDNPLDCKFKINPSPAFQRSQHAKNIYFSIHGHQSAQELIHIKQLETLISQINSIKFEFSEDIIIDDLFTMADLPQSIDGDALYDANSDIINLLKAPRDSARYELRYIDPNVGFGLFSRDTLAKGDIISLYSGIKTTNKPTALNYSFKGEVDYLNMYLDARPHGNITRFINHAPKPDTNQPVARSTSLLEANIKSTSYYLNGIEIVVYSARRDIFKGEQLLVDYGTKFFKEAPVSRFKTKGRVIYPNKKFIRHHSRKKLNHIRVMASHGIRKAQVHLQLRLFVIVVGISVFMGLLKYV